MAVTRHIIGYKQEESDWLLKFLYDHIARGQDFQVRIRWAPKTVVVWDVSFHTNMMSLRCLIKGLQNRVTAHSATLDWNNGERRHIARITPQAERPEETPFSAGDKKKGESDGHAANGQKGTP